MTISRKNNPNYELVQGQGRKYWKRKPITSQTKTSFAPVTDKTFTQESNASLENIPVWSLEETPKWNQPHPYTGHKTLTHLHSDRISVALNGETWGDLKDAVELALNTPDKYGVIDSHHIFIEGFFVNSEGNLETITGS